MSLTDILSAEAIENGIKDCEAPESFSTKRFFQLIGLTKKSPEEIREVFRLLDDNNSGFIEEQELKPCGKKRKVTDIDCSFTVGFANLQFFLQRFGPGARILTENETKNFMSGSDGNSDGKIGVDEFLSMVLS